MHGARQRWVHRASPLLTHLNGDDEAGMVGSMRRSHRSRWHWSLIGLALVLAFVGHDLAMAGDAHQTAGSRHHGPHHSATQTMAGHHLPGDPSQWITHGERPMNAATVTVIDGCGDDRIAVLTVDDNGLVNLQRSVSSASVEHPTPLQRFSAINEPTAPPGDRRALLQVFLI